MQWLALVILFLGVSIVEIPSHSGPTNENLNAPLGFLCVVGSSILSGLACVFFEMVGCFGIL